MKKSLLGLSIVIFLSVTIFFVDEAYAMFRNNVFSSPFDGVVLNNGLPVDGAVVSRKILGDGLPDTGISESVTTGSNGRFYLPSVERKSFLRPGFLGAVPKVLVEVNVEVNQESYLIFFASKKNFMLGGEGFGEVIKITCDISKYELFDGSKAVQCEFNKE